MMYAVLYQFKIKPGREKPFESQWSDLSKMIRKNNGHGSRLHKLPNGIYLAYGQWQDEAAWKDAGENASAEEVKMREAMLDNCTDVDVIAGMDVIADYL